MYLKKMKGMIIIKSFGRYRIKKLLEKYVDFNPLYSDKQRFKLELFRRNISYNLINNRRELYNDLNYFNEVLLKLISKRTGRSFVQRVDNPYVQLKNRLGSFDYILEYNNIKYPFIVFNEYETTEVNYNNEHEYVFDFSNINFNYFYLYRKYILHGRLDIKTVNMLMDLCSLLYEYENNPYEMCYMKPKIINEQNVVDNIIVLNSKYNIDEKDICPYKLQCGIEIMLIVIELILDYLDDQIDMFMGMTNFCGKIKQGV